MKRRFEEIDREEVQGQVADPWLPRSKTMRSTGFFFEDKTNLEAQDQDIQLLTPLGHKRPLLPPNAAHGTNSAPQTERREPVSWVRPFEPAAKRSKGLRGREVLHDENEFDSVFDRVLRWMINNKTHLPTRYDRLKRSIRNLCTCIVQVDPNVVFFHLMMNQVIRVESGTNRCTFDRELTKEKRLTAFAFSPSPPPITFSEDFLVALKRSAEWIISTLDLPSDQTSLLRSLEQICRFKREIPPSDIVDELLCRGFVVAPPSSSSSCCVLFEDSPITYSLPDSHHRKLYSPSEHLAPSSFDSELSCPS